MERYSLYIDHQQVSKLIRQLQYIVKVCYQQLDEQCNFLKQQYIDHSYQLRPSIYEEFVFQITTYYHKNIAPKKDKVEYKDQQMKKFYELTAKLQGINGQFKIQQPINTNYIKQNIRKGRPVKDQQAELKLIQWIRQKIQSEGKLKFQKKQIDNIMIKFSSQNKKKIIPVGSYLRMLKKYDLNQVIIKTRGGKENTVESLQEKKSVSECFVEKFEDQDDSVVKIQEENDSILIKSEYGYESQLESTSEMQSINDNSLSGSSSYHLPSKCLRKLKANEKKQQEVHKKQPRSLSVRNPNKKQIKFEKFSQKARQKFNNIFDHNSDHQDNQNFWENIQSVSHDNLDGLDNKHQIYENSRSFEI